MTDITAADCTVKEECGQATKKVTFRTDDTVDNGDVVKITLSTYGITNLLYVNAYKQTTVDSAIAIETPGAMAVSGGVLSVTIGGATPNLVRVVEVVGY